VERSLSAWLAAIGCGGHASAFAENNITFDLLADLTDADLRELGMNIGDRKRFMRALADLEREQSTEPSPGKTDESPPSQSRAHAERRRLTVMFVDLVGSTVLSSRLDPEAWSEVLRDYQNIVAGLVTRLGGHVAQYLGDGVLCYFGWPQALEASAERAVEAGLEVIGSIGQKQALGQLLSCRVGIATGLVVVGELVGPSESTDRTAIGETPNLAARLQAFAKANQIVISESTRALLGNAFIFEHLGEQSFKGIEGAQPIYAVVRSNPEHNRFAGRDGRQIGAMIGRGNELALLLDRWSLANGREGQTVTLVGEAGIGKSRICRALLDEIGKAPHRRITYQCSPYHRDTALWPVISQLKAATGIKADDSPDRRLDKLERLLGDAASPEPSAIGLIADLIGLDGSARYGELNLSPSARRAATFAALLNYLLALSERDPLLLFVEDAHWADPTTAELIGAIVDHQEHHRIMLLITVRPENTLALPSHSYVSSVTLNRLGRKGVEEIVQRLGGGVLPSKTIEAIIERTDGVPLFVEELTKAMIEGGETTVPASLHDTLMARLDRLPEVKEVAQIASVFGREFETDPLAEVARLSRQGVMDALDKLRKVELVFSRLGGDERHLFKHALVRDAAYESLLIRRRQEIHGRIFEVLKDTDSAAPGVLAQHAAEAGRVQEAVEYGRLAAEQALRRPAYAEAIAHLDAALALLAGREEDPFALRERKRLLLLSGQARIAHFGYAAETTVTTYAEIERIARQSGDRELLIDGLYGRWAGHFVPGRLPLALEVAEAICAAGAEGEDSLPRALGARLRGTVLTMMGRVAEAAEALDEAEACYDPERHAAFASRFGQDVGVAAKCYRIGGLSLEGRFNQAEDVARAALEDINRVNHPHTAGYGLGHLACFLSAAEIMPLGGEVAEECIRVSELHRLPLWAALGRASLGMTHLHAGRSAEASEELEGGLAKLRELDFTVFLPILLPAAAIAAAQTGDKARAEAHIAEAKALASGNDALFFEPEIFRAEGEVLAQQGHSEQAAARFQSALDRARSLGHRGSEFKAAESSANLLIRTGRAKEGMQVLKALMSQFDEGRSLPMFRRIASMAGETV
jgi:class 3 adenylate cyclase/tetratricopeptide (TPR) repeat protein